MPSTSAVELILFSQHGMTDDCRDMEALARRLAPAHAHVVAPNLGFLQTLFRIEPLIDKLDGIAERELSRYPSAPARILATSLGGVLWVEVLTRHPEWWQRFESLVLLGAPLGGADLARIVDPMSWGLGIAKPLGENRRVLAERIAAVIPTLVVAGDVTGGGDGTVPIEATKLQHAHFVRLDGVSHPALKTHPAVVQVIREFWSHPREPLPPAAGTLISRLIEHFRAVPGITDTSERDFAKARTVVCFGDGTTLRTRRNLAGVDHVYIADPDGRCEYAAFVGWIHSPDLQRAIDAAGQSFRA